MPELIPDLDLYAELELGADADTPAIEAAWRRLIRRNHPDLGPAGSIDRSVRLNVAHDWLADPSRRARYDADRAAARRRAEAAAQRREAVSAAAVPRSRVGGARAPRRQPVRMARRRSGTGLGGHLVGMAAGAGFVVVAILAIATALGGHAGNPSSGPFAGAVSPPPATVAGPSPAPATPAPAPSATPSPTPTPSPSPAPSPSPTLAPSAAPSPTPIRSIPPVTGSGNRDGIPMELSAGSYAIGYAITGPGDATCSWVLWLRDASGVEGLAASAYPLPGQTVRDTETEAFVTAGPATARVESDCPRWSFTLTFAGP